MKKDELFLEYLESENGMDEYGSKFENDNLNGIKQKFYEKAGLSNSSDKPPKTKNGRVKLSIWIAATLVICMLTGAMAFGLIDMSPLISIIGEKFGTVLQPINMVDEYDGIEVKTLAAINDDDMVYIYFTIRDLTEDRINSSIDLCDNYILTNTIGLNCEVISFDEATKTVTLRMKGSGGKELNGKKISMIINSFYSGTENITGKWVNKFTINSIGEVKEIDTDIALEEARIKKIFLSPLGVKFVAQGDSVNKISEQLPMYDFDIILHYKNGEFDEPYNVTYYAEPGEYNIKYVSSELIDVEKVTSITINGESINFE